MVLFQSRTLDGKLLVGLGLSLEDCAQILDKKPVVVEGSQVGLPDARIVLVGNVSALEIMAEVRAAVSRA